MGTYIASILENTKQICNEYLQRKIGLLELQARLSALCDSLGNDIPINLRRNLCNFVEDLEYIRFMYNEDEYFHATNNVISTLNLFLETLQTP